MMRSHLSLRLVILPAIMACALGPGASARTTQERVVRVYHIGNSLTFGVVGDRKYSEFMSGRGTRCDVGYHILWGQSLETIWQEAAKPSTTIAKYGGFTSAFKDFDWDALTLQTWGSQFATDLAMAKRYIELATARSPNIQVYIYETWPFKDKDGKIPFATKWTREFPRPGNWDAVWNSTYCTRLIEQLNKDLPGLKKPVRLVPVGAVLFELDRLARRGELPGVAQIEELYKDDIHLLPLGEYIGRVTYYAVIRGDTPSGLPASAIWKDVPDATAKVVQETVWRVVTTLKSTGVAKPKAERKAEPKAEKPEKPPQPAFDATAEREAAAERLFNAARQAERYRQLSVARGLYQKVLADHGETEAARKAKQRLQVIGE